MGGQTTPLPALLNAPQPANSGAVTLYKSTLKPINAAGNGASGPVTLDKSTLQPIAKPGYGAANLGTPEDISTGPEGSNPDSRLMSPQSQREASIRAPLIVAGGAAAGAGIAAGAALTAPTVVAPATATTETVGTGILDYAGKEITKDVLTQTAAKYGPSLAAKYGPDAAAWLVRGALGAAGAGGVWKAVKFIEGML